MAHEWLGVVQDADDSGMAQECSWMATEQALRLLKTCGTVTKGVTTDSAFGCKEPGRLHRNYGCRAPVLVCSKVRACDLISSANNLNRKFDICFISDVMYSPLPLSTQLFASSNDQDTHAHSTAAAKTSRRKTYVELSTGVVSQLPLFFEYI